jgi:hypothetical protein
MKKQAITSTGLFEPRIFSLEYIRQRFNFDQINFGTINQKTTFSLPTEVFYFIVKNKSALPCVENNV